VGSRGRKDSGSLQARHFQLPILSTLSINDLVPFRRKESMKRWKRNFQKGTKIISTTALAHINMKECRTL
jgi:hypothetical protein